MWGASSSVHNNGQLLQDWIVAVPAAGRFTQGRQTTLVTEKPQRSGVGASEAGMVFMFPLRPT
jgi:hypothetical protein